MNCQEALKVADAVVFASTKRHLKDIEVVILKESWKGLKYEQIAAAYGYTAEYLKHDVGPKLWKLLSEALGEKVSKKNFQAALERHESQINQTIQFPTIFPSNFATKQPMIIIFNN
ncbi:MAG TPA: hypothetical protein VK203_00845 [Nostocaceae cyanobacterium]|nr:hypothetical protein [Nostocaceae cyanobacterium]